MIGKTIKSILTTNSPLTTLVPAVRMFPYVMDVDTDLPAIVYTVDSLNPEYSKKGWELDNINFSVHSFGRDYSALQSVVSAVRTALELSHSGYGTQGINKIYLSGMEEGYDQAADVYFNKLTFSVRINTY